MGNLDPLAILMLECDPVDREETQAPVCSNQTCMDVSKWQDNCLRTISNTTVVIVSQR